MGKPTRTVLDDGTVEYRIEDGRKLHRVDGPARVYPDGTEQWYLNGKFHRDGGPAAVHVYGEYREADLESFWYQHGELHRVDGPAVVTTEGVTEWWVNGNRRFDLDFVATGEYPVTVGPDGNYRDIHSRFHRVDGPALIEADGYEGWYVCGRRHRVGGPALVRPDGLEEWYLHGDLHRTDGPAVTRAGGQTEWWDHGLLHRVDGPAIVHADGTESWYHAGTLIAEPK